MTSFPAQGGDMNARVCKARLTLLVCVARVTDVRGGRSTARTLACARYACVTRRTRWGAIAENEFDRFSHASARCEWTIHLKLHHARL